MRQLLWLKDYLGLHVDTSMDLIALSGIALSLLACSFRFDSACQPHLSLNLASRFFRHPLTFALLWVFYLSLFSVGQAFLHFQWDILLLEVASALGKCDSMPNKILRDEIY